MRLEDGEWDLLVIGGGIAGATIFRDAARRGLRVILAERDDFAGGASSHSSKLIHGGLHYLARGQLGLARTLVHERDRLIETMPGLVEPVEVLLPLVEDDRLRRWGTEGGLCLYEAFAGRIGPPRSLSRAQLERRSPGLAPGASGALVYTEATVDDAGLVLRALAEGRRAGGLALNGLAAEGWLRDRRGRVAGAFLRDSEHGAVIEVRARAIVNATGAEVEQFRGWRSAVDGVRLVRGSHLVLSHGRLPIEHAVAARHPDTGEALYVVPWQGAILVGSTNIACAAAGPSGFRPSEAELTSLLRGVRWLFPGHELDWPDVVAVYTGLRTIAGRGRAPASRASRELVLWVEDGVWNVAGGKLSTAGLAAAMVLDAIAGPATRQPDMAEEARELILDEHGLDPLTARRLSARYGAAGCAAIAAMPAAEQVEIPGHRTLVGGAALGRPGGSGPPSGRSAAAPGAARSGRARRRCALAAGGADAGPGRARLGRRPLGARGRHLSRPSPPRPCPRPGAPARAPLPARSAAPVRRGRPERLTRYAADMRHPR